MKINLILLFLMVLLVACPDPPPPANNHAPIASFIAPASGTALTAIAFDASASSDPDKDALTYSWDFGDGLRGGGVSIAHEFSSGASFMVKLTVSDGKLEDSKTQIIVVSSLPAPTKTVTLAGLVTDTLGAKLEGVKVEIVGGFSNALSLADGTVSLTGVGVGVPLTIKLSKTGFSEQYKSLELPNNTVSADAYFSAELKAREAAQILDSSAGGILIGKDAAKLELPANALVDANGQAVTGNVNVNLTPVNVTDVNGIKGFPGSFMGVKPDGGSDLLTSFGTVEYALEQRGQRLNLKPGTSAMIEIPAYANTIEDGSSLKMGDRIPLWSLNESTGNWVQEGTGILVASSGSPTGLALRAEVTHFSWWNADHTPDPSDPDPNCEDATDIGIPEAHDAFANAQICNMLADFDQGSGRASIGVNPRQTTSIMPGFNASKTIGIPNTSSWRLPANINLILKAYALNGTWYGEQPYRGLKNSSDKVVIKLRPLNWGGGANIEAISVGWNKNYVMNSGIQTDKFSFSIPARESRRITIASQNISTLEGTVRVMNGTQVIASTTFNPSSNAAIQIDAPSTSDYTLEVTGTKNFPGGYTLKLEKIGVLGSETISGLPFYKLVTASGLNASDVYQYKFSAQTNDLLRIHFQIPYPLSGSITLFHNQQTIQPKQAVNVGGDVRFNSTLPETGEYLLEVEGASTYALTVQKPTRVNLDSNTTVNITTAFPYPSFVFDGTAGSVVGLGVGTDDISNFPLERWFDPSGTVMRSVFPFIKSLPISGTYSVDFSSTSPFNGTPIPGSFTLGVSSIKPLTPILPSILHSGTIDVFGDQRYYSLTLAKGDIVRVAVQSPNTLKASLQMRRPSASIPFYEFPQTLATGIQETPNPGTQDASQIYVAPEAGDYVLGLNSSWIYGHLMQQTGGYTLKVFKPTPGTLGLDTPNNLSLGQNDFAVFNLNITQAGYYDLLALETTVPGSNSLVLPVVIDSNGQALTPPFHLDPGFNMQLQPGSYQVIVDPFGVNTSPANQNVTRTFTFGAATLEPPSNLDFGANASKDGVIDQFNELDYSSFSATKNQQVTITASSLDGLRLVMRVYLPKATDFTSSSSGLCNQVNVFPNSSATCSFVAPSDANYIISLENAQPGLKLTGNYRVALKTP